MQRLICFFLLSFFMSSPVYAVTIVDIQEIVTVITREDLSDCEWIETTEVKTVTTYREAYPSNITIGIPSVPLSLSFLTESLYNNPGGERVGNGLQKPHPCFPESTNGESKIPDTCNDALTLLGLGYSLTTPTQLFWEWSEVTFTQATNHYNECKTCNHNSVPEPTSVILVATGFLLLFFLVRKQWLN